MSQWNNVQVQEALQAIFTKAATDEVYRQKCLTDAHAAVLEVTGEELPPGFQLRFVANEGADMTLVLPDLEQHGELKDDELENVAGGVGLVLIPTIYPFPNCDDISDK